MYSSRLEIGSKMAIGKVSLNIKKVIRRLKRTKFGMKAFGAYEWE